MKIQCTHGRTCKECPNKYLERVRYHLVEAAGIMEFIHISFDNVDTKKMLIGTGGAVAIAQLGDKTCST